MLHNFIITLAVMVNVTEAKVGIKSLSILLAFVLFQLRMILATAGKCMIFIYLL